MKIRCANKSDIQGLYAFNHRMYPERMNYKEIVDFWVSKRDDEVSNIVLAVDDQQTIKGQQFFSSMDYFLDGKKQDGVWAFDLIADEDLRAQSQGFSLMWKCKRIHPDTFSSGSNDTSLPINLKIGNSLLGHLKKYIKITNPLYAFNSLFRGQVKRCAFPESVGDFEKQNDALALGCDAPYNDNLFEIGRDQDFMAWRFYNNLHEYVVYKLRGSKDYFVVRTIVKKHLTALVLVDYRCNLNNLDAMATILDAFEELAKGLHLFMTIVGSSLDVVDGACEKNGMKSVGRDRPILGMIDCHERQADVDERKYILLTLADSDGEITW